MSDDLNYEDPVKRPGDQTSVIVIIAFVLMLSIPYIYMKIDKYFLSEEEDTTEIEIEEIRKQAKARQAEPEPIVREAPRERMLDKITERQLQPGDTLIYDLSIMDDGFVPVDMKGPARSLPLGVQFYPEAFTDLKIPEFSGKEQWYGVLELGNQSDKQFHVVLDLQDNNTFLLHVDRNNNNDLTDDGKPLRNTGTGPGGPEGFACRISIPWKVLIKNAPFEDDFNIWFFLNEAGWNRSYQASYYSQTQLQKFLRIGDQQYVALLIDGGKNDADLSNDGIAIDLNRNGKIDREERSAVTHMINGLNYEFTVHW